MALIKNAKSDRLVKEAVVLDMGDLARQAERMLAGARSEAAAILASARAEAQQLVDGADARGHSAGFERGMEEGQRSGEAQGREHAKQLWEQKFQEIASTWVGAVNQWESQRAAMLHEAREDVIRFAYAVAHRVVLRLVQSDPTIVQDQLAEALKLASRPAALEILINPDDRALAEESLPGLMSALGACEHSSIKDDPSITRGGCIIATAGGRVDARIDTQLDRIAAALVPEAQRIDRTQAGAGAR
jgi:flagellar assembly protein FliH